MDTAKISIQKAALDRIKELDQWTLEEQLKMVQIPAPTFQEEEKGNYVLEKMQEIGLEQVHKDEAGNVFGIRTGYDRDHAKAIFLAAHLDTVFPMETDLTIRQEGNRYYCPGISDNTRAIAEILTLAKVMVEQGIRCKGDLIFCANVCEEGLGDLKGVKYFFEKEENQKRIGAFLSLDNDFTGAIIRVATGSKRFEVTFSGPGGHSFGAFGITNPIHAMGRAIGKIAEIKVPAEPKTTFNVGIVEGGISINTIAKEAKLLMDIRSNQEEEIDRVCEQFFAIINEAAEEENARWGCAADSPDALQAEICQIGHRPAGEMPLESELVQAAMRANEALGIPSILDIASSTDANLPVSLGIPSITLGRGGTGGGTHTTEEWYEAENGYLGVQRDFLLLMEVGNWN